MIFNQQPINPRKPFKHLEPHIKPIQTFEGVEKWFLSVAMVYGPLGV